ncbi:putative RNA helicase [Heterostelium album PN500]|uniref:RNA helicase n=1 Tax=Heterostelium pallidum (strain ATCC 26659 / Pp 5 / PN500) TaxID=670386 RepID=D3B5X2_HETP5|nr:putative RNA helicase [Heterostelium album PN500]EFA83270.1 putative RNA helicase [Heterostelium album PN500]|eukprot:XP_020435387.1 putative RNA helicase [Heterostelium album PN500]
MVNNVKLQNKKGLGKSRVNQNKYLENKKKETKEYKKQQKTAEGQQNSIFANQQDSGSNNKNKVSGEKKKKVAAIKIKDKLTESSTGWKVDSSFFDRNITGGSSNTSNNTYDDDENRDLFNSINEDTYDSDIFSGLHQVNDNDDDDVFDEDDDLDLDLEYNQDAIEDDDDDLGDDNDYEGIDMEQTDDNSSSSSGSSMTKTEQRKQKKLDQQNKAEKKLETSFPSIEIVNNKDGSVSFGGEEDDDESGKKKKKKISGGGFQSMELHKTLFKAIVRKGFKVPTPIQRKTIPLILAGSDVVAMARTGSGKTAAFVVPMIQKLGEHSIKVGARAIILSPTRELAIQTYKVVKDFTYGSNLRSCLVVGGDSMEDQFAELARNPDIIVATPGRLVHHLQEVGMGLSTVQYIVFDEADRLFEMGFQQQLNDIVSKLSDNRQTLLFSATLPSMLVDFVRAGLTNPILVRLDSETKISENLALSFYTIRHDEKLAVLLYLLKEVIEDKQPTIIFTATKYHVEYLQIFLKQAKIDSTIIHGYLDPVARKINLAKFRSNNVSVMIVTDIAARGIDIPLLDNVINFDFPPKEKIFVHRVGRVARAGRKGTAYSLVSPDEIPYMIDLHLYLARKIINKAEPAQLEDTSISLYGNIPQHIIDRENEFVKIQKAECVELASLNNTINNAYKKFVRTRPGASHESNNRAKELNKSYIHPSLLGRLDQSEMDRNAFVQSLKAFRPPQTVFELEMKRSKESSSAAIMYEKRKLHSEVIDRQAKRAEAKRIEEEEQATENSNNNNDDIITTTTTTKPNQDDVEDDDDDQVDDDESYLNEIDGNNMTRDDIVKGVLSRLNANKKRATSDGYNIEITQGDEDAASNDGNEKKKRKTRSSGRDESFFISSTPSNYYEEKALSVTSHLSRDDELNLNPDDQKHAKNAKSMKWDKKKGKFVGVQRDEGKKNKNLVRNEAGVLVDVSKSKKNVYEDWKKKTRSRIQHTGEDENERLQPNSKQSVPMKWRGKKGAQEKQQKEKSGGWVGKKVARSEIKDKHVIQKQRQEKERKMKVNKTNAPPKKKGGKGGKGGRK